MQALGMKLLRKKDVPDYKVPFTYLGLKEWLPDFLEMREMP